MAKTCMIERDKKRSKLAARFRKKRAELKARLQLDLDYDEKMAVSAKLQQLPRDSSRCRQRTRCHLCGRPRAVYSKFNLCRIHLREAVMRGDVPGLRKGSW